MKKLPTRYLHGIFMTAHFTQKGVVMEVIAIDMDDVLWDFVTAFTQFCRVRYGVARKKEDFVDGRFDLVWGVSNQTLLERFIEFGLNGGQDLPPFPGAQAMIALLAERYVLQVVTKRPRQMDRISEAWLGVHFPENFSAIHYCTESSGVSLCKSTVCAKIGARILLEDHPENIIACARTGIEVYAFNQPWNQEPFPELPGKIIRVESWNDEALKKLL